MIMKSFRTAAAALALAGSFGAANAVPSLQLGIAGGTYDPVTQTIVASGPVFSLYAFLDPANGTLLTDNYLISAALSPQTSTAGSYGSFTFDGTTVNVTSDMVYGRPPLEANLSQDPGDLAGHGIYDTYFKEFGFTFNAANKASFTTNNTQDNPGLTALNLACVSDCLYYSVFTVDVSALAAGYSIHFDLYNEDVRNGDTDVNKFAPFSHDAQSSSSSSGKVPEPSSSKLALLGLALLGLSFALRRQSKR